MLDFIALDDNAISALVDVLNVRDREEERLRRVARRWLSHGEETAMVNLIDGLAQLDDERQAEIRRALIRYEGADYD